jgi:hypothetical protein
MRELDGDEDCGGDGRLGTAETVGTLRHGRASSATNREKVRSAGLMAR